VRNGRPPIALKWSWPAKPAKATEDDTASHGLNPAATPVPAGDGLSLTEPAVRRVRALLAKEGLSPETGALRLGVIGGGCSGMSYSMTLDTRARENDHIFAFDGVRVFVDPKSFVYLKGLTLDYEETLIRQGFNYINPNATRSCGCGTSFST
jgi:iron-sulfur cluster assembly protein